MPQQKKSLARAINNSFSPSCRGSSNVVLSMVQRPPGYFMMGCLGQGIARTGSSQVKTFIFLFAFPAKIEGCKARIGRFHIEFNSAIGGPLAPQSRPPEAIAWLGATCTQETLPCLDRKPISLRSAQRLMQMSLAFSAPMQVRGADRKIEQ